MTSTVMVPAKKETKNKKSKLLTYESVAVFTRPQVMLDELSVGGDIEVAAGVVTAGGAGLGLKTAVDISSGVAGPSSAGSRFRDAALIQRSICRLQTSLSNGCWSARQGKQRQRVI